MYIIAKQASIPIEHTPVYGYHHHLSFYKLSSTIKSNLLYQARQRSSVQVDRLKGGCTIFDVEHMSCSLEFWTQKSKKNFKHFFCPTYGHCLITYFYCQFENVQSNWLDRSSWNFQDRQKGGKFCPDLTPMADFRGRLRPKMARKIRNTYIGCTFSKWQ